VIRKTQKEAAVINLIKLVTVPVRDQDRALDFYTRALGFQIGIDQPNPGTGQRWIELKIPGCPTRVVLFTPPGQEDRVGTASNIVFTCDSVEKTWEELEERGVQFPQPPKKEFWGTSALFQDPDGNTFALSSR
jgi:predicted enzyme related to lactoylglutathione lyase